MWLRCRHSDGDKRPSLKAKFAKNKTYLLPAFGQVCSRQEIASGSTLLPGTPRLAEKPASKVERKSPHRLTTFTTLTNGWPLWTRFPAICAKHVPSPYSCASWSGKWQRCDD